MLRYGYLGVGLGGVGQWRSCQLVHTRHATLLLCSLALAHTRHATLWWSSLALAHTRHATLWWSSLALAHTWWSSVALAHTRHATLWLSWGGVGLGWGNNVHVNLHTHTSCYVIVMFSCTCTHTRHATLWWSSLALAHTRHATLWWSSLALAHTRHATLWWSSLALAHTRHAHHCFCRWKPCLGVTCQKFENQTCQSVSSKQRMEQTNAKNLLFFPVHCGRDANRWQMVERPFQDGCMMESTQKNTLNWKSLSWVTVGENLWDHWHLTGFSKNFARPSKQWSASEKKEKKCCIPKKHELMSKNEVVLEIFNTLFFTSTWEKMTFRCRENDIFIDEKLLKPYAGFTDDMISPNFCVWLRVKTLVPGWYPKIDGLWVFIQVPKDAGF